MFMKFKIVEFDSFWVTNITKYSMRRDLFQDSYILQTKVILNITNDALGDKDNFYLIRSIVPSKLSQSFITFITSIFIQNQS